jgi:hypothetical protein
MTVGETRDGNGCGGILRKIGRCLGAVLIPISADTTILEWSKKTQTTTGQSRTNSRHEEQEVVATAGGTGSVNQELLLQNEYLAADNRILRTKLPIKIAVQ